MFSFPLIAGDVTTVLLALDEMVISDKVATAAFNAGPDS
jgi:hypothetical protein